MSECIHKCDWGTKIVAKKENNLFLLEKEEYSKIKGVTIDGKVYRTYDNWLDHFTDLSDYYIFTKRYLKVLSARNLDEQLDFLRELQDYPESYCGTIETMIEDLGLWEFDLYF